MGTIVARKTGDGTMRYRAQVRIVNDEVRLSESRTFSREVLAKEWIKKRERELEEPGALLVATHRGIPFKDLLLRYHEEVCGSYGRSKRMSIKALSKMSIADKNSLSLKASDFLEHVRERREAGAGPATVSGDLIWFRSVFRYAKTAWNIPITTAPIDEAAEQARASRLIAKSKRRTRRPSSDELKQLEHFMDVCRPRSKVPMRLVMWLAIYSCRRVEELTRIQRKDIDWAHDVYKVRDMKHPDGSEGNDKEPQMTPLCRKVMEEIIRVVPSKDGRLLPFSDRAISTAWRRACELLSIEDLHFHDLRHEGASRLAEDGWTIPQIQSVTMHESWSSLQIYVNVMGKRRERYDYQVPDVSASEVA